MRVGFGIIGIGTLALCVEVGSNDPAQTENQDEMKNVRKGITKIPFGLTTDGAEVDLYTLVNHQGSTAKITNYGGIIVSLTMPDKNDNFEDVVLGYDSLVDYLKESPYFGALIGRYGNRVAEGKFTLEGREYSLPVNNGPNSLHGGHKGFDKVVWKASPYETDEAVGLKLSYQSQDGEQGYPGNLNVEVRYTLDDNNNFRIDYKAETDQITIVNLTQHTYFNLSGNSKEGILNHALTLHADSFIPVNENLIPTGELQPVSGTPFDFTSSASIGARINEDHPQLINGQGYDHCWVLNGNYGDMVHAGTLYHPISGRRMEIHTTEPGIQFYSGNFLDGTLTGKYGKVYKRNNGMALESQHFPDSPNQPSFPSVVLNPGEIYTSSTIYKFDTKK